MFLDWCIILSFFPAQSAACCHFKWVTVWWNRSSTIWSLELLLRYGFPLCLRAQFESLKASYLPQVEDTKSCQAMRKNGALELQTNRSCRSWIPRTALEHCALLQPPAMLGQLSRGWWFEELHRHPLHETVPSSTLDFLGMRMGATWTFLRYTKKCSETKNAHFQKKCYKPLKSAHLVVSFCRAPPHVQTAGSPRILATYTDTITLCLGSRCLGSPQPTSFAAAASKSSNSLGWAELDT